MTTYRGITLDTASIRTELVEAHAQAGNPHGHTASEVQQLLALPEGEVDTVLLEEVDDHFWEAYDALRTRVIARLTREIRDTPV